MISIGTCLFLTTFYDQPRHLKDAVDAFVQCLLAYQIGGEEEWKILAASQVDGKTGTLLLCRRQPLQLFDAMFD